jgi:hypothetical protein
MLFAISGRSAAQLSEIDSYDRAVTSQTKVAALAFIDQFRSSHLVGDLIESLRLEVAREVCADLPSGVSRARRACEQLRNTPVAEVPPASGDVAGGTAQSNAAAAPTQPIETQPIGGMAPAPTSTRAVAAVPTAVPQVTAPAAGGQSESGAPPMAVGTSEATGAVTAAPENLPVLSGLPEPAATSPPTPITSRPTVYVRTDSAANILAQATESSVIIGTASGNTPLTVVGRDRSWLKVLVPGTAGQTGWIQTSGLQSDAGGIKVGPTTAAIAPPATSGANATKAPATQVATETAPTVTPTPPPSAATAGGANIAAAGPVVRIWLASLKSRELAERDWRDLRAAYDDLLGNLEPTVRQVDLGPEKGIWYRIYAGPLASRDEARTLCAEIKSRPPKSNCLIVVE